MRESPVAVGRRRAVDRTPAINCSPRATTKCGRAFERDLAGAPGSSDVKEKLATAKHQAALSHANTAMRAAEQATSSSLNRSSRAADSFDVFIPAIRDARDLVAKRSSSAKKAAELRTNADSLVATDPEEAERLYAEAQKLAPTGRTQASRASTPCCAPKPIAASSARRRRGLPRSGSHREGARRRGGRRQAHRQGASAAAPDRARSRRRDVAGHEAQLRELRGVREHGRAQSGRRPSAARPARGQAARLRAGAARDGTSRDDGPPRDRGEAPARRRERRRPTTACAPRRR